MPPGLFDDLIDTAPAPAPKPSGVFDDLVTPAAPEEKQWSDYNGIGDFLAQKFPGVAGFFGDVGTGKEAFANESARGLAGLGVGTPADLEDINRSTSNDARLVQPGTTASRVRGGLGLAQFLTGPGAALTAAEAGGNRRLDVLDRGGSQTQAALAGLADAGVNLAVPKVAHVLGAPAAKMVSDAAAPYVAAPIARAAGQLFPGALMGAGLGGGEAAISRATGDKQRAAQELASIPEQMALGGAIGAGGSLLGSALTRDASPAPSGVFDDLVGAPSRETAPTAPETAPARAPILNAAPSTPEAMASYHEYVASLTPAERTLVAQDLQHLGDTPQDPVSAKAGLQQSLQFASDLAARRAARAAATQPTEQGPTNEIRQPEVPSANREAAPQLQRGLGKPIAGSGNRPGETGVPVREQRPPAVQGQQQSGHEQVREPQAPVSETTPTSTPRTQDITNAPIPSPERPLRRGREAVSESNHSQSERQPQTSGGIESRGGERVAGERENRSLGSDAGNAQTRPQGVLNERLRVFDAETTRQRTILQNEATEAQNRPRTVASVRSYEYAQKRLKGRAFERAAERRALVQGEDLSVAVPSGMTAKELAAARAKTAQFNQGKTVATPEGPGVVVSNPVGKVRVKLADGTLKSFDRARVSHIETPKAGEVSNAGENNQRVPQEVRGEAGQADLLRNREQGEPRPGNIQKEAGEAKVDNTRDVPYTAGTDVTGKNVYIDKGVPRFIEVNGKPVDAHKYIAIHERAEEPHLHAGMRYEEAHKIGIEAENTALRADGIDPKAYNDALKPFIESARAKAKEGRADIPTDLETKPYTESNEAGLLGANQRATSTRPDLAIPSASIPAREMFKEADRNRTAAGEPGTVSHGDNRAAAEERLSNDFEGERAALNAKIERGDGLNAQEAVMGSKIVDRLIAAGDSVAAMKAAELYRRGGVEGGRSLGIRFDPLEKPAERAQRNVSEAVLAPPRAVQQQMNEALAAGDKARYDRLLNEHAARIHSIEQQIEQITGIDPHDLAGGKQPKTTLREKLQRKTLNVDREFTDLTTQLKNAAKNISNSAGSTGGEMVDILTKMIANRLQKGLLKAADVALAMAKAFPEMRKNAAVQAAFKQAWNASQKEQIEDVSALFKPTLDEQLAAARERLATATERHAEAFGQTPAERLAKLEAKTKAKEPLPPDVQSLHEQAQSLSEQVRNRDRAITLNAMRVLDAAASVKADLWDKVYEYRRNVVHTSLRLPLKKVASDTANAALHMLTDFAGRPLANLLPGGADRASFGDAPYAMRGLLTGLQNGWRNALEGWATQRNVYQDQLSAARIEKSMATGEALPSDEFHQKRALTGLLGKITGWNIRAVGAFQTFAETTLAHMQVGAEAYRRAYDPATGERLTGQALEDHMHRETSDLTSDSWTQADTVAKDLTGVTAHKRGPIAWLNKLANRDPKNSYERLGKELARHTALFRTLPFNFLVKGIYHLTPLNGVSILGRGAKSLTGLARRGSEGWTYKRAHFNTDIAQHALGWATTLTVLSTLDDDKGQPNITGYGKWTPADADVPLPPAHSIKINGEWHDYSGLGPLAHALGTITDTLRGIKSIGKGQSTSTAAKTLLASAGSHVVNETWMRGVRDLYEATQGEGKAAKFTGTFASSFYPTMFKDAGKAAESTVPDRQVKDPGFWGRTSQVIQQQLGVPGVQMTPSVDVFGQEIAKDDGLDGQMTTYVDRLVNPFTGPPENRGTADEYRKMIVRWNEDHPTEQLLPKTPAPYLEMGKKRVDLTPQQYHDFCVDAGQRALAVLGGAKLNTAEPVARDAAILKRAVSTGQAAARQALKIKVARDNRRAVPTATASSGSSISSPDTPVNPSE